MYWHWQAVPAWRHGRGAGAPGPPQRASLPRAGGLHAGAGAGGGVADTPSHPAGAGVAVGGAVQGQRQISVTFCTWQYLQIDNIHIHSVFKETFPCM